MKDYKVSDSAPAYGCLILIGAVLLVMGAGVLLHHLIITW